MKNILTPFATFTTLKNLVIIILSLVVLAGSFTPCCPTDNCRDEVNASSQNQDEEKGSCSPFSACASCCGFVQLAKQVSLPIPQPERPIHYQRLATFFASTYYFSFFQPPRNNSL
jgi:hypothetical protein